MFCMKCGAQLQDGAVFCMQCGTRIGSAPAQSAAKSPAEMFRELKEKPAVKQMSEKLDQFSDKVKSKVSSVTSREPKPEVTFTPPVWHDPDGEEDSSASSEPTIPAASAPAPAPAPAPNAASAQSIRLDGGTRFVAAKCPNCGAALEVDAAKEAAICPYCNTPYIVDKAINMVQIGNVGGMSIGSAVVNVNGVSAGPMVERVLYLEKNLRFKQALQICERALEIDPYNMKAMEAETRLRKEIDSYIYDEIKLPKGSISIRREDLMIQEKKSSIKLPYTLISSVKGEDLIFEILKIQLKGEDKPRTFRLADGQEGRAKAFAEHIKHAMTGAYDM